MQHNNLTYTIDNWNIKAGHIQLNVFRADWSMNTYPVIYQTNPEIDEVIEEIKENKSGQWVNDENDQPKREVTTKEETIQVPTGKKIPNPNYRNPQSIEDLEAICIEQWFTK